MRRSQGGGDDVLDNLELLHANCHRQIHTARMVTERAASRERRCEGLSRMRRKAQAGSS